MRETCMAGVLRSILVRLHATYRLDDSYYLGPSLDEQLTKHRPMAARLILAITANGKIRLLRQCRKQIEDSAVFRISHLATIALYEGGPPTIVCSGECNLFRRWRQMEQPDVVPVALRELRLGHPARWAPHRTDTQTFVGTSVTAKTNDSDSHLPSTFRLPSAPKSETPKT